MKQLLVMFMLSCSTAVFAQDVIVKKDGSTILAKVLEVNTDNIKYKKHSNQNGPTYTILVSELLSINYSNGEKDEFSNVSTDSQSVSATSIQLKDVDSSQGLIKKPAADNNAEIIARHNVIHPNISGKPASDKAVSYCTLKFGVTASSIMSNADAEISFIRKVATGYDYNDELCYFINIKNKTDKVMYVDRGNCFKVYSDGYAYCYYDASKQTTVNQGGGSGGSVNLGSVAGALGIGGVINQLAGGVNVGGGTTSSISTSYATQRIIAIPPHGSKYLTEYVWIGEGKRRTCVESPEFFSFDFWEKIYNSNGHDTKGTEYNSITDLGLRRGVISKGQTKIFGEKDLPWKRGFYITYSTDDDIRNYSVLNANLYIQEIIGEYKVSSQFIKMHQNQKWYLNENIIVAPCWLDKK